MPLNFDIYTANNLPSPDSVGKGGAVFDGTRLRVSDGDAWIEDVTVLDDLTVTDVLTVPDGKLTLGATAVTATAAEVNKTDGIPATHYLTAMAEVTFTETAGAGTYTGTISLPAGSRIIDIGVDGQALWTATTSASLIVGDGVTPDGFFVATDLKATDLLAGEINNLEHPGGMAGAYIASEQRNLYQATARDVIGVVTTEGAAGSAGRTRLYVVYCVPTAVAATKA